MPLRLVIGGAWGAAKRWGARLAITAAGPNVIVANATGCLEVFSTSYPDTAWNVAWIHSLFENAAAVASGVEAALKALGRTDTKVIAQGGDGGTADIGLQALSGMLERGHDVLYICYDNEAYMNTGVQRSSLTPFAADTRTSPSGQVGFGNQTRKKDLPAIAAAHNIPYLATATIGFYQDLERKVKKAMKITGPKFLQIHVPCPLGWAYPSEQTIKIAKLAVSCGLVPIYEMENGVITSVRKISKKVAVTEYLQPQGRFRHLFRPGHEKELVEIQAIADANIQHYGLM